MNNKLHWGIIGTGLIAHEFADGVAGSLTGSLWAVASRQLESAQKFAAEFNIPHYYSSYQELIDDPQVAAIYIATPHPMHAEWAIKAAEAGKHLLVEKPIGLNLPEAMAMIDIARENNIFLMEAFMYRCHPQMARVREIISSGKLGKIQLIRASFAYRAGWDPKSRFLAPELAGGGILDVGCYPVSIARFIAGAAQGIDFAEPLEVKGVGHLGKTGIDEYAIASLRFDNDLVAELTTGIRLNTHEDNFVQIYGSEGKLTIPEPWIPSRWDREPVKLILQLHEAHQLETILIEAPFDLYSYEADMVGNHIQQRQAPVMSWDDTIGNMRVLDSWRNEVKLVYPMERPENYQHTIDHQPLKRNNATTMTYGEISDLNKPISRLIMGADSNHTMPDTAILFDDFFRRGGNTFDTSHAYGIPNGACEKNLGWWIKNRGIRDQVVVIEKGANTPNDDPDGLTRELFAGLERLQLEHVDIYMVHRDNEAIPIGEWVEVLNMHQAAGRMSIFGLSNFSIPRLRAFQEYAEQHGLNSFSCVSNQFSLARLLAPIWDMHLVSSSDAESRRWFFETQTPLLSWSSQARGFFTPRAGRQLRQNEEFNRCWYSEDNFQRKDRAEQLARDRGVSPINIALAWVLQQPFPTFPLVGPKRISETADTIQALKIPLSAKEMAWLNLEKENRD